MRIRVFHNCGLPLSGPWLAAAAFLAPCLSGPATGAPIRWADSLKQPAEWYGSAEALRIADNLLLYQRRTGGWPKNIDMARRLTDADEHQIRADQTKTDSTIDNGATTRQLEFLGRVLNHSRQARFEQSFLRGLDFLLAAQYPNGGWPQFHPHPKGYQAHITFNDGAMVAVLELLQRITRHPADHAFVDPARRARARQAFTNGIECILRCQVVIDGRRTAWCAQHDETTLAPAAARAYEKPSLSGAESVGIARLLMSLDTPDRRVIEAVESAIAWFQAARLTGLRVVEKRDPALPEGRDVVVVEDPQAPPLWARFYEIGSNRPMFSGRDGVVKFTLAEIEHERRTGYSWYTEAPARLLEKDYPAWKKRISGAAGPGR
ncbi:MAG TPA: pectate lyase [Methylomirabilota bacterium]|nr:pectate lyase [Methylomirabilota bacterium]